eukprot:GCRY01001444.1.p1 GENE.GCRY01001444.1~~GCRY01001444.1.p1  ORF type:complete len:340 (+),score=44.72 GCRY01001444.1:126-1145(+)
MGKVVSIILVIVAFSVHLTLCFIHSSPSGIRLTVQELSFSDGTTLIGRTLPVLGSQVNPGKSCQEIKKYVPPIDGVYWIFPAGGSKEDAFQVYCDMTTDGGGWTLMFKVCQNAATMADFSSADYEAKAQYGQWIKGINVEAPLSPTQEAAAGELVLKSLRWADVLVPTGDYQLRATVFSAKNFLYDAYFGLPDFPGFFLQDEQSVPEDRAWKLTNKTALTDTTGIAWDDSSTAPLYFYPPFTSDAPFGSNWYSGCNGFLFDQYVCGHFDTAGAIQLNRRRPGSAGIILDDSFQGEVAPPWFPIFESPLDLAYTHKNTALFGHTGADMCGMYWSRPEGSF